MYSPNNWVSKCMKPDLKELKRKLIYNYDWRFQHNLVTDKGNLQKIIKFTEDMNNIIMPALNWNIENYIQQKNVYSFECIGNIH